MALTKVTYVDNVTVIGASNLNAIQDEIIANGTAVANLSSGKVDKINGKGLSTNDFSDELALKLSNIEAGATHVEVDDELSENSTNAVQNKVVAKKISEIEGNDPYASFEEKTVSGAVANFPDGAKDTPVKSLIVNVDPVQDLHGQANPYPAGGGKNILNPNGVSGTNTGVTFTKNDDGTWTAVNAATGLVAYKVGTFSIENGKTYVLSGCPSGGGSDTYHLDVRADATSIYNSWVNDGTETLASYTATEDTTLYVYLRIASGYDASGKLFKPMICLSTASEPTTFAPYSNICPITGHTGANVHVDGKNILNLNANNSDGAGLGVTVDYLETGIKVTSPAVQHTYARWLIHGLAKALAGKQVTLKFKATTSNNNTAGYVIKSQTNGTVITNYVRSATNIASGTIVDVTFNIPDDGAEDLVFIFYGIGNTLPSSGNTAYTEYTNLQLELGSSATTYEAPSSTTIPITFPDAAGTVYGGTLTNQGTDEWKLRVDRLKQTFNGTENFGTYATGANKLPLYNPTYETVALGRGVSNMLRKAINYSDVIGNSNTFMLIQGDVAIHLDGYQGADLDMTAFKQTLAQLNPPLEICYEIATPVEYTLTGEAVETLLGVNNIWADTGDSTVTYRADPTISSKAKELVIKAIIAPVLTEMKADTALVANDFRIVGDTLYKITSNIASGGTLTVGTNCTATTIGEQLKALLNA